MATEFHDWQQRVIDVQKDLKEKLDKLTSFINSDPINKLDPAECNRLRQQYYFMYYYNEVLESRIRAFNLEDSKMETFVQPKITGYRQLTAEEAAQRRKSLG